MKPAKVSRKVASRVERDRMYASLDNADDPMFIYIGGRYYGDDAQIHLSRDEANALHGWLCRVFPKRRAKGASK